MQPTPQAPQMPTVPAAPQPAAPAVTTSPKELREALETVYQINGEEIKLNAKIVRETLLNGDGDLTDAEIIRFIALCKFNKLNPYLREAYVTKFKNNRGGNDSAQMVISKEAYFKRAERCADYDGIQAGIIIQRGDEILEVEGNFMPAGWTLAGGWAKVYRKNLKYPIVAKVNLSEYDKGMSTWNSKKNTMIAKVAKVQALREAFTEELGGLYIEEEMGDIQPSQPTPANTKASNIFAQAFGNTATTKVEETTAEVVNEPAPVPANEPADLFNQQ